MTARALRSLRRESLFGVGLGDQALMSAANFATMVVLARALAPADFGVFVLAYTGLLLLNGLQAGLITQPHNVLGQGRRPGEYPLYTSSTAAGQLVFAFFFASLALAAAVVAQVAAPSAAAVLFALVPAIIAWQGQEFTRRVLYTERRLSAAFVSDVLSYGGQVAVLVALASKGELTPAIALYVIAGTSALGTVYGGWKIRGSLARRIDAAALRENWAFGKWLGAAIAASWFAGHLYVYLAALIVGPTASGALRAAQVVLGPLNAFFLFLFTVLPIRFARTRNRAGDAGLHADLTRIYLMTTPVVVAYCLLAAVFASPILNTLYGDTYAAYASVVVLFAVYYFLMHVVYLLTAALAAKQMTRSLFRGSAYGGLVGIAFGWLLVAGWEVEGAALGMILGALVVNIAFWRAYRARPPAAGGRKEPGVAPAPTQA